MEWSEVRWDSDFPVRKNGQTQVQRKKQIPWGMTNKRAWEVEGCQAQWALREQREHGGVERDSLDGAGEFAGAAVAAEGGDGG